MVRFYLLFLILKLDPFSKAARVWQPELQKAPETRSKESEKKEIQAPRRVRKKHMGKAKSALPALPALAIFAISA